MKKLLIFILIFLCLAIQVHGNCFQVAQEFNCAFERSMKCNGEEGYQKINQQTFLQGECECKDGSVCKWRGREPLNDNCPCDQPAPRRKRRRRDRDDM